jgi:sphingolipid 8-(E)-desaturase
MERFCIGQVNEPWVNFTPPIRGGTFRTQSEAIAPVDHATGLDVSLAAPHALARVRTTDSTDTDASSVDDYISRAVQGEINSDIQDFPSLDMHTQRVINLKYRALHDRVAREGFYQCRYSEYGKEALRYTGLFACSLLALRSGWYLTSAAFLGLFWVGVSLIS